MRILVVEDDLALRETLVASLRERGHAVEEASGGAQAIALAQEIPIDIVISDIRMEGTDGLAALEEVQKDTPEVQSLVITGYSTEADSIRAIKLGVGDYLKKPFRMSTFLTAVERLIEAKRMEQKRLIRESSQRQSALWSLENFIHSSPLDQQTCKTVIDRGRLAYQACCDCGLSYAEAEEAQICFLVARAAELAQTPPSFFLDSLPEGVHELLGELKSDHPLSLGAQICVAAGLEHPQSGVRDGRVDTAVQASVERLAQLDAIWMTPSLSNRVGERVQGRRRKSLLALAHTLENSQDRSSAIYAYRDLLTEPTPSRETVKACLALGRLEDREEHFTRAVSAARRLGPKITAEVLFGVEEYRFGRLGQVVTSNLEEALTLAQGSRILEALIETLKAHATKDKEPETLLKNLSILTQPSHLEHLRVSANWLFPLIFNSARTSDQPAFEQAAELLRRDFRAEVERLNGGHTAGEVGRPEKAPSTRIEVPQTEQGPSLIRFMSLGPFRVFVGGEPIDDKSWKSQKVRYLLAHLAYHNDSIVSEDVILELFWPNSSNAKANLRPAVSYIRRYLVPDQAKSRLDPVLRVGEGFRLNPDLHVWHDIKDVLRLEKLADQEFQAGNKTEGYRALQELVGLYNGPYLDGSYEDWVFPIRQTFDRILAKALMRLSALAREASQNDEALEYCYRLLEIDPCHQKVHLAIMRLHLENGRPEEAIRQFRIAEEALEEELGLEPSEDLQKAYQLAGGV